tara:strand:+ start:1529 stop:1885 length:357 start_codon:yes stop_codon:yes gene_type:complete
MIKLMDAVIGTVSDKVNISVQINKTKHAGERQTRHDHAQISEKDIINVANKALPDITKALLFDRIDVGDYIHVKDKKSALNLIGILQEKSPFNLMFVIMTVMIKPNFVAKKGTYTIVV